MTMHRPGLPGDLPSPEALWARWGLLAVLEASAEDEDLPFVHRTGIWIDGGGLHLDDCGCTWWTLARMGEGRFVLYGEDESSDVKWHKPPIDMLAGAPDWLPFARLRDLIEGYELGCVYWYENGAWSRAPYPEGLDDDGLDCGMSRFVDRGDVLGSIDLGRAGDSGPQDLLGRAERYELTPRQLESVVSGSAYDRGDLPAMLRALRLTGLAGEAAGRDAGSGEGAPEREPDGAVRAPGGSGRS
ncbi:hypothetical protein N4G70_08255 [Streptomyces sp. ASQP_92]|uniref:hypothetical protein n=1 Tax=Streptomyces sp. ASQP_92 TaxID=2979116 RepID=UPI0021C0D55F|nr:hypothetical protein [Streptomyces sp. ASQP_92]MCT9088858.1 hypothetical protein [Streptomyces sp. ASQP_92]